MFPFYIIIDYKIPTGILLRVCSTGKAFHLHNKQSEKLNKFPMNNKAKAFFSTIASGIL